MKSLLNIRGFAAAMICSFLVGCAATRVDVDVYKGPLANHEHVQMQQMAAMAIGAKPLLIHLRDHLEGDKNIKLLRDSGMYSEGAINNAVTNLHNDGARRVNGILSLYQDKGSTPQLAAITVEMRQHLQALEEVSRVLLTTDANVQMENRAAWKIMEKKMVYKSVSSPDVSLEDFADFKMAYELFLNPEELGEWRNAEAVARMHTILKAKNDKFKKLKEVEISPKKQSLMVVPVKKEDDWKKKPDFFCQLDSQVVV